MRRQLPAEISATELAALIDDWILSERDRRILKRRLIDHVHFEPLAEEMDMSPRHVKRIVYHGMEILIRHWPTH